MPRHKVDVPQDTMIMCARCTGNGVIGQRNGVDVPCPACGGDGRIDSRDFRSFQGREERRYASYESEPTFTAVGREEAVLSLNRVEATWDEIEAATAGDLVNLEGEGSAPAGVIQVAPIGGGSEQHFRVVGGYAELARAINENDMTVRVEVFTDTQGARLTGDFRSTVGQFMNRDNE